MSETQHLHRAEMRVLRVAPGAQTLLQEMGNGQAQLVHELALRPGVQDEDPALELAKKWQHFNHPSLHALTAAGVTQPAGSPGQVLHLERPLPRGTSLAQILPKLGALTESVTATLFLDLARGMQQAHNAGLVLGNLAAESLLLCPPGRDDTPPLLLVDAGMPVLVTLAADASLTPWLPPPEAQAPEVLTGQAFSSAADSFGLCATVALVLLGHPLFHAESQAELRLQMNAGVQPAELKALTQKSPKMGPILARGLAPQPWARTGVLAELIAEMSKLCELFPTTRAQERTVLAPWALGSPLIPLAAYASAQPWLAQFGENLVVSAPPLTQGTSAQDQARLRAALDLLEMERLRAQNQTEAAGRNVLTRLILIALIALIAAAIAASAVRESHRMQSLLNPQRPADTALPVRVKELPKSRVIFESPRP